MTAQGPGPRTLNPNLSTASDRQQIIVRLSEETSAVPTKGERITKKVTRDRLDRVKKQQTAFLERCGRLEGVTMLGSVHHVLNAVFLEVDARQLEVLAKDPAVVRIAPVANYKMDLTETVPYIGGTVLQANGIDGSGVRVAVLDSGVDYLHANLGGSGSVAEYVANDKSIIEPGSFPTARVVGGYDFVGGVWPNGPLAPDPDPLDEGGHGTHVADIIGGTNGVAPGASLYAVQVCSSVSSSCSGVALIQAMDFAADPNGDGDTSDHVDVVNMSLGSDYGQPFDDDLSAAVEAASVIGVFTVASAGNGGDVPYKAGSPAATPSALSVAQTAVPSAELNFMTVLQPAVAAGDYLAVFQPWSVPQTTVIEGAVTYGNGSGGNLNGCAAFPAGSLTGQIVFVDRGACAFSVKIFNIQQAGGVLGIIGLVAPGEPFAGGFGGGGPFSITGYMIDQASGDILRTGVAVARFDPNNTLPLVGSIVSSSSRGPSNNYNAIKPEIGAPGGSVSAEVGTGTGETAFSGTSGAAPMVAGAAALMFQARAGHFLGAFGYDRVKLAKSLLMNYAETDIRRDFTGVLAEITRIGSGEVRVDESFWSHAIVWSVEDNNPGISLGAVDVDRSNTQIVRHVEVKNLSPIRMNYKIRSNFRFDSDETLGAVTINHPSQVVVPPWGVRTVTVRFRIDGSALNGNFMSSGSDGNNPATLTLNEIDGYLTFDNGYSPMHMPWQVLPRRAARVTANRSTLDIPASGTRTVRLRNRGVGDAQNTVFTLLATSPDIPEGALGAQSPTPDLAAVGVTTIPVPAGFCSASPSFVWAFAVNSHERQTHLLPVIFEVDLDTDGDGAIDHYILNLDLGFWQGGALSGQEVTIAGDVAAGTETAFFFTEHAMNTGNTILYVCGEQVGLTGTDLGVTQVGAAVFALDFYFGGPGDVLGPISFTPGGERYTGTVADVIAPNTVEDLVVTDNGAIAGNSDMGIMVVTNSDFGVGARGGATEETEALIIPASAAAP